MAHLNLYRLAGLSGYALEVQADLLASFETTIVVPILPENESPTPMTRLNPIFEIDGRRHVMVTQSLAAISRKELGEPVGTLSQQRYYDVANALDMLLAGS